MGWIIDSNVHGLLDDLGDVVHLPTHYGDIVHSDAKTQGITMIKDKEGGLEMFLEPFPNALAKSPLYPSSQPTGHT